MKLLAIVALLLLVYCNRQPDQNAQASGWQYSAQSNWWKQEARRMVAIQIEGRGIRDSRVLDVMRHTPRHLFVPPEYAKHAYSDYPLPIGEGQTVSQPYIVALMTELLQLDKNDRVLEIGTGSGYQAAILAQLAEKVYTIEIVQSLADSAKNRLQSMGYNNIVVRRGDGYKGWPEHAPFDKIIVTAAPGEIPPALVEQLKVGGLMVIPVGDQWQALQVIHKVKEQDIKIKIIAAVRFVPMVHPEDSVSKE